jgi:transglutaminase-like putative cysteine protease
MLDVFRDTSSGEQFRSRQSNVIHYVVQADQPMRMKTATFSTYNFKNDSWKVSDLDSKYRTFEDYPIEIDFGSELADAIFFTAKLNKDFAEKYGLEEYAGRKLNYPEKKTATVISRVSFGGETVPVPQGATSLDETNFSGQLALSRAAAVFTADKDKYYMNDSFTFSYLPETPLIHAEDKALVDMFGDMDNYGEMVKEAYSILDDIWRPDDETKHYRQVINVSEAFYDTYTDILLDYNNDQRIYDLAQQITAGLDSEYDKAKAIEWYFVSNDFRYDLSYQKAQGENVDDFLFRTKTGVCVEYATAMVMLARAAGIPARYCEGYLMNNEIEGQRGFYALSANDGHAFPELYIRGYGWVTFEPTMSNTANLQTKNEKKSSTTDMLKNAGYILLIIAAAMLLLFVVMPYLTHKAFILLNRRRDPDKAVAAVMHRLCRLYGIPPTNTADEARELMRAASGADVSATAGLFNRSVYGEIPMTETDRARAMEDYLAAYAALKESKKKKRKLRRTPQGGK